MKYLTTVQVGKRWGYSANTLREWCRGGHFKGAKKFGLSHEWRIPLEEVAVAEGVATHTLLSELADMVIDK